MLRSKRSLAARQREMRKRQPPKRGRGRPPLPINGETVRRLSSRGWSMIEIANALRCCPNTIRHRFAAEFAQGQSVMDAQIVELAFHLAVVERHPDAVRWQLQMRGLCPPLPKPERRPRRACGLKLPRRQGRGYQPFRNRYRPQRRRRQLAPRSAPPKPPAPPRQPWTIREFLL